VKSNLRGATGAAGATVLAPISWGTSYVTITELLPDGRPLLVATMRVVPSGLALLMVGALASRWRPRGREWWRTGTLGVFNFGIFFPLLVAAVYRLPGGVAAAAGGLQPLLVAALSWRIAGRRPQPLELAVGCVAALGVALVVIHPGAGLDPVGVLAAIGANISFAVGVVLTKRFPPPPNRLAATGWQLLMSGLILVPLTVIAEGAPPSLSGRNIVGFAYLSLAATALAFVLWFNGIRRLPTAAPPLLGLAAPVTGAVLGWAILGQSLSPLQLTGFVITIAAIGYGASLPVVPSAGRVRTCASGRTEPVVGHRVGHTVAASRRVGDRERRSKGEGLGRRPVASKHLEALPRVGHRGKRAGGDPPQHQVRVAEPLEPFPPAAHHVPVPRAVHELGERVDRLPHAHVEEQHVVLERTDRGGVAGVGLQPPDEAVRLVGHPIDRLEGGYEAGQLRRVERCQQPGDVALG
jgi:probable blue pigment (indigoidine) exporter